MGSASNTLVAIVGATGTGKTRLSLDLAEELAAFGIPVEIVNADAMQLYRGMDIGTAKVSPEERRGIPHHMLDVLDPAEEASVARYQADARSIIGEIRARGATPILVGGSGLYVSSVVWDFTFPATDPEVRARLEAELGADGPGQLHRRLAALDAAAAEAIGPHNGRRIVRALEVIEITGEPFGAGLPEGSRFWSATTILGLTMSRDELVPALDERVTQMWRDGLLAEVETLRAKGLGVTASRAIGYAQALAQLDGERSEGEAIGDSQALTRKYARRQVSWFKRYPATWFAHDDHALTESALRVVLDDA